MILVVDNYDSFTYNLVDIVAQHTDVIVQYPDDDNVLNQSVDAVIISPGPGHPLDDQQLMKIISTYQHKPILGICLGAVITVEKSLKATRLCTEKLIH